MADSGTQDQSTIVSVQGEDVQIFTRQFAAIIQNITSWSCKYKKCVHFFN